MALSLAWRDSPKGLSV